MRKLFWVAFIVFAGWCAATEDGKRFVVQLTSAVGLTPPVIELDFEQLDGDMTKETAFALHPELDYYCYEEKRTQGFGEYACNTDIALFNGMASYNVALFFKAGKLNVMRVALQPDSYSQAVAWLDDQYERTDIKSEVSFTGGKKYPVTVWKTGGGDYVLASQSQTAVGETIVLWTDSIAGFRP